MLIDGVVVMSRESERESAREAARQRAHMKRVRDMEDALPDGRAIERALAESLKSYLARVHGGDLRVAVRCPVVRALIDGAMAELAARRYDMMNGISRARIRQRLALNDQKTIARQSV